MDKNLTVLDENGNELQVDVLDIFNVEGYDHDYILYTSNKEVDAENIEAYVSILVKDDEKYLLTNIEDEAEWNIVQKAIYEMGE